MQIVLHISEEYGYRTWVAVLTTEQYQQLLARWSTIKGLNCMVPVKLIVPQAVEVDRFDRSRVTHECHIHECDDSYLAGSDYRIPDTDDGTFVIEGRSYAPMDLYRMNNAR